LRELRPDVVHAHWFPGFAFFATLACASPLVAMAWGSDVFRASARQQLVNRLVARRADLVMTDSADLLERLHELGAPRERGMLINWGVDLTAFSPQPHRRAELRRRLGLGTGPVILSPRSLSPVYNIPTIVEAFARLAGRFPDAQLVLKHMSVAEPDLGELPHPERIKLVGHVAYELMADYYRAADVCVSIASSDSSPRSAWEALACACPLVVSDLPWVHELIEPERHALVVPIDPEPLSAAIERLLNDAQLGERLRVEGRALVEAERDRDAEMARLARAYVELARRPPRRPGRAAIARKVARSSGKARRSNRSRPAR
jgi:glycosyltransferase involved in cell wall biosynthesis